MEIFQTTRVSSPHGGDEKLRDKTPLPNGQHNIVSSDGKLIVPIIVDGSRISVLFEQAQGDLSRNVSIGGSEQRQVQDWRKQQAAAIIEAMPPSKHNPRRAALSVFSYERRSDDYENTISVNVEAMRSR